MAERDALLSSPVERGCALTDGGNVSARIREPRFASADYTGILPEEDLAERNRGRSGRSKSVPKCKQ